MVNNKDELDRSSNVSRTDLVGGTLVGFGAALLTCSNPQVKVE
jgi:hypothetical protein